MEVIFDSSSNMEKIFNDGFFMEEGNASSIRNLAPLSLRIALLSYFSSYRSMKNRLSYFENQFVDFDKQKAHTVGYREYYYKTILFFHHFIELTLKEILANQSPIGFRNFGFNKSLTTICDLINKNGLKDNKWNFIRNNKEWLEKLNNLRNGIWHREAFILSYLALDKLVGKYVLPFVANVIAKSAYNELERIWKYKPLKCGVDPINAIINDLISDRYNLKKVSLLKELGRAAYENPIESKKILRPLNENPMRRADVLARSELESKGWKIIECPVCGLESLVVYDDIEIINEDPLTGKSDGAIRFSYSVKCSCCTFEVDRNLDNPSIYGLPIQNYWEEREL